MIYWFSATGNSRYAAQAIRAATGDMCVDLLPLLREGGTQIGAAPARRAAAQGPFRAGSQKEICYSAVRVSYRVNLIVLISNGRSARRSFFSLCASPSSRSSRLHSHQLLKGKAVGMVTEV